MGRLQQQLTFRKYLAQHLTQMSVLARHEVKAESLESLDETCRLRSLASTPKEWGVYKIELDFEERHSSRFHNLVEELWKLNPRPVYVWTKHASTCGVLSIPSIHEINFSFDYHIDPNGIITFSTEDMKDHMTLEFFEDQAGTRRLQVLLMGENWSNARY